MKAAGTSNAVFVTRHTPRDMYATATRRHAEGIQTWKRASNAGCTASIRFSYLARPFIYPHTLILIKTLSYMVVLYILDILDCPLYIRGGYVSNFSTVFLFQFVKYYSGC